MKKALKIAHFEFVENVKTKSFMIFTLLFPLIALGISIIPELLINNIKFNNSDAEIKINEKLINNSSYDNNFRDNQYQPNEVQNSGKIREKDAFSDKVRNNLQEINNLSSMYISSTLLVMLLFMLILFSGGMLIRSLVEEKSNRIIEILLSSCTANELLTGKILGLSLLGLLQLFVWISSAVLLSKIGYIQLDFFSNIGIIIIYFILGYIFFSAIFVGAGSIVNTEQEAQQFSAYLSLVMVLPLMLIIKIVQHPNSEIVKILSYIPLTTPPVMILRVRTSHLPWWEIALTIFILLISIYLTIHISSKIFRVGILSYGKHPSLKELYQWFWER